MTIHTFLVLTVISRNKIVLLVLSIYLLVSAWSFYYFRRKQKSVLINYYIFFFILAILLFSISINWFVWFIAYELLALTSVILIVFYKSRRALEGAFSTLLFNKIADIFLLIVRVSLIFSFDTQWNRGIFLYIARRAKASQVPWRVWLCLAITAPTVVRSLVHSSTLVASGILLAISHSPFSCNILRFILSRLSLFVSFLLSLRTNDIKKVVALSTISQLRRIILLVSINNIQLAILLIIFHSVIKRLLFLCIGNYISSSESSQHKRNLRARDSVRELLILLTCFSLSGLLFSRVYYIKEMILENVQRSRLSLSFILSLLLLRTIFYSIRICFFFCNKRRNSYKRNIRALLSVLVIIAFFHLEISFLRERISRITTVDILLLIVGVLFRALLLYNYIWVLNMTKAFFSFNISKLSESSWEQVLVWVFPSNLVIITSSMTLIVLFILLLFYISKVLHSISNREVIVEVSLLDSYSNVLLELIF